MFKGFDREKILRKKYEDEISSWDWNGLKQDVKNSEITLADNMCLGCIEEVKQIYLGTIMSIYPSCKVYAPWTTNQTQSDVTKDNVFDDVLEEMAEKHGLHIVTGEGDPCDLFLRMIN